MAGFFHTVSNEKLGRGPGTRISINKLASRLGKSFPARNEHRAG